MLIWILVALVVVEAVSGGFVTANVAGAAHAAGGAAWREASSSAKAAYARRAEELAKTAIGRWKLKNEARLGRAGRAVGLATWRGGVAGARIVAAGAVAGAKAAKPGAAKGRQWRTAKLATARHRLVRAPGERCTWETGYRSPVRLVCGRPVADGAALCPEHLQQSIERGEQPEAGWERGAMHQAAAIPEPDEAPDADWTPGRWIGPDVPGAAPAIVHGSGMHCPRCRQSMADRGDGRFACPRCGTAISPAPAADTQPSAPEVPARGTEEPMSGSNLDQAADQVGVVPYLAAWDGEGDGGAEIVAAQLDALLTRVQMAGEKNRKHDPDGVADVVAKIQGAIDAVGSAGEAVTAHATSLHAKWDSTVERAKATGAESAEELLGAR